MPSSPPTLDQLEEMERKATPKPWVAEGDMVAGNMPKGRPGGEIIARLAPYVTRHETPNEENAALIAALRNAAPGLLRLWRAAEELEQCRVKTTACSAAWDDLRAALADLEAKEGEDVR